jgi:hypothetical protein
MKKLQSGISAIFIILALLAIGIIGVSGWHVYRQQRENNATATARSIQSAKTVAATDSTKSFSYAYSNNWSLQKYEWTDCCEGPTKVEPDWTRQTQPITLKEQFQPLDAAIRIDEFGPDAISRAYGSRTQDAFNTYTKITINGYDALRHVTDFVGPSAAEKYKDHEYIISNAESTKSIRLQFRERYSNSTLNGENDFDASAVLPDFEKVVRSVRFLH